jgi:glycerol dehydrogenase-like iron-containing ADH family enzyme
MEKRPIHQYVTPVLLGVLMFASNFINTGIFRFGANDFAVWFVVSLLCFASGYYMNKVFGWHAGGKVIFAIIIAATALSILVISFFREYFAANELLTENLILYSLRNITLGAMAIFGMAIDEVLHREREATVLNQKLKMYEEQLQDARKEAELELREAKVKAEKLINDAQVSAKNTILKKERIERELKEFIQAERELIKRYEES